MLRLAVIGAGKMGKRHIECFMRMPDVKIVAVVEPDSAKAFSISTDFSLPIFQDIDSIPPIDAASIVTPSITHRDIAIKVIEKYKVPCLIEKPLAVGSKQAYDILNIAEKNAVFIAVGHSERFNPALLALESKLENLGKIYSFVSHRLGHSLHIKDVNMFYDLLIHDLDIVLHLLGNINDVSIDLIKVKNFINSDEYGFATIQLDINDIIAYFSLSKISNVKTRSLDIYAEKAVAKIDYLKQSLKFDYVENSCFEEIIRAESLVNELRDFIESVKFRRLPLVSAEKTIQAIKIIEKISLSALA